VSKYLSGHFVGSAGYSQAILSAELGIPPNESTASVWKYIRATQPEYPGTVIPRSFTVSTSNGTFWTHGNATKHMYEALISIRDNPMLKNTNPNLFAQFILYDYRKALIAATGGAIRLGTRIRVGHWEFILGKRKSDECPVVKHALFSGLN
jgi:hypothetical protein